MFKESPCRKKKLRKFQNNTNRYKNHRPLIQDVFNFLTKNL